MLLRSCALALASALALAACHGPSHYLEKAEDDLGVNTTWYGSNLRVYHVALENTRGLGLREPGYLVGVENIHPADARFLGVPDRLRLTGEHHVITHVMRYNLGEQPRARGPVPTCALFTLLDRQVSTDDPAARLFEP